MANGKSNVNVRIDTNVKELATQLLARMGLDQATAIDMFYRQIIAERRLPFQPVVNPTLDEQLIEVIKKKNIPPVKLEVDGNGHVLIDKDKHLELYDWAANG